MGLKFEGLCWIVTCIDPVIQLKMEELCCGFDIRSIEICCSKSSQFLAHWTWSLYLSTLIRWLIFIFDIWSASTNYNELWQWLVFMYRYIFIVLLKNVIDLCLSEKQREFYKNAKYVQKFKRSLKQQEQQNDPSTISRPLEVWIYTLVFVRFYTILMLFFNWQFGNQLLNLCCSMKASL